MKQNQNEKSGGRWFMTYVVPPIGIIALAVGIIFLAIRLKPEPETSEPEKRSPTVETIVVSGKPVQLAVISQGTVAPRSQTMLVAEVGGRIQRVAPAIYSGNRFSKGDILVEIDPVDYEAALANAQSRLADAELALEQEKALAEQAKQDWTALDRTAPNSLALREPQLKRARASLQAAQAGVESARRDLERTRVRAPYDGITREKQVDVGQVVAPGGTPIASIFATDTVEVRLPVSLDDLAFLPMEDLRSGASLPVSLTASVEGKERRWAGSIVRVEGAVDTRTRLVYLVAQVEDPYDSAAKEPPLRVGMFVEATIEGRRIAEAFEIPRASLQEGDRVYLLDDDARLRIGPVNVVQGKPETVVVDEGLSDGDRLVVTKLEYVVEGMHLTVENDAVEKDAEQ